jgi:hypothetical protein
MDLKFFDEAMNAIGLKPIYFGFDNYKQTNDPRNRPAPSKRSKRNKPRVRKAKVKRTRKG